MQIAGLSTHAQYIRARIIIMHGIGGDLYHVCILMFHNVMQGAAKTV